MFVESNGAPDPGKPCESRPEDYCRNDNYVGLTQLSSDAIHDALLTGDHEEMIQNIYEAYRHAFGPNSIEKPRDMSFQKYYNDTLVNIPQFSDFAIRFVDGRCFSSDIGCVENAVDDDDGFDAIELAAAYNATNREYLKTDLKEQWNLFSPEDQNRIIIAAYNGGEKGILSAIQSAIINSSATGTSPTWDDVVTIMKNSKIPSNWCQVVIYPANADCYAIGGGASCMQYPDTYLDTDGKRYCK
jgi:hypothetical protein